MKRSVFCVYERKDAKCWCETKVLAWGKWQEHGVTSGASSISLTPEITQCQALTLQIRKAVVRATAALNVVATFTHTGSQKVCFLVLVPPPPALYPGIRTWVLVVYLRDALRNTSRRMENFNRDTWKSVKGLSTRKILYSRREFIIEGEGVRVFILPLL